MAPRTGNLSVYHAQCKVLVDSAKERCGFCTKLRKSLTAMASRAFQTDDRTCPSSHTTYGCLHSEEMSEHLRHLQKKSRLEQPQIRRLQEAIVVSTGVDGVTLDDELQNDFLQLAKDHTKDVLSNQEEGTFQRLFWSQQQTAGSLKNDKSMQWHLLIIKWCLYFRYLSGKAYELLHSSTPFAKNSSQLYTIFIYLFSIYLFIALQHKY